MTPRYIAIDPGNVTGVAVYDEGMPRPDTYEVKGGLWGFVKWAMVTPLFDFDMVFVEDFIIRPDTHKKTREPAAYELLGWIKGTCYEYQVPCYPIGPAEHTPFSDYKRKRKSKIVRLGWSAPSKDMHADSASSILLLGLVRHNSHHARELLKEIA